MYTDTLCRLISHYSNYYFHSTGILPKHSFTKSFLVMFVLASDNKV